MSATLRALGSASFKPVDAPYTLVQCWDCGEHLDPNNDIAHRQHTLICRGPAPVRSLLARRPVVAVLASSAVALLVGVLLGWLVLP